MRLRKKSFITSLFRLAIITLVLLFFSRCTFTWWDKPEPYYYSIIYKNESSTAITLKLSPTTISKDYITILPDSVHEVFGFKVDKREDVIIDGLFGEDDDRFMDEVTLFWNDSFYRIWYGPIREMGESTHHFFNIQSWTIKEYTDPEYITGSAIFSIIESDLVNVNFN